MLKCQNCQKEFVIPNRDASFYKKLDLPYPKFCPDCRLQRRLAWRNERTLYKRNCDLCKKEIISLVNKDSHYKVYCSDCWWGDKWNPKSYGQNFDFSRSFFEQFHNLMLQVPRLAIYNTKSSNSDYTNFSSENKNCYLITASANNEDCYYSERLFSCQDCLDSFNLESCQLAFASLCCLNCYNIDYCEYSENLTDCKFCYDCKNCSNCFGCYGLRNKSYYFLNEQLSKDQYNQEMNKLKFNDHSQLQLMFQKIRKDFLRYPRKYAWITKSENVTGDVVERSKNSGNIFFVKETEDSQYLFGGYKAKDCLDCTPADKSELCYESMSLWNNHRCLFSSSSWQASNIIYSDLCFSSSEMFGCIGVRHGKFMVLNKQYSQNEYYELIKKIVTKMKEDGEWGEFFPVKFSPYGYEETVASEHFPIKTKKEATKKKTEFNKDSYNKEVRKGSQILNCANCLKDYKVLPSELTFYQKKNLPIPEYCPQCRHQERFKLRNPLKLWHRQCMNEFLDKQGERSRCKTNFYTPYAPNRPEKVYCEECYQKEVY